MYRVRCDFQASRRDCRSFQPRPAHQAAASRARSTAAFTSAWPNTAKVAITSEVAGLTESKVSGALVCPVCSVSIGPRVSPVPPCGACYALVNHRRCPPRYRHRASPARRP